MPEAGCCIMLHEVCGTKALRCCSRPTAHQCARQRGRKQFQRPFLRCSGNNLCNRASLAGMAASQQAPTKTCAVISKGQPTQQQAAEIAGISGMAGITKPGDLKACWSQRTRPRLDALWGSIQRSRNAERVLLALDDLLMQLRSSRSLASHLQKQHEKAEWRAAAAQVAADCRKYETYILGSKMLANKLTMMESQLQYAVNSDRAFGSLAQHNVQQQAPAYVCQPSQLLQLCRVLLASVKHHLPEDSQSWLAALESSNPNAVLLQQLKQEDYELVARIDAVVALPVLLHIPRPPRSLLSRERPANTTSSAVTQTADGNNSADATNTAEADSGQAVLVTTSLLAKILQTCSDRSVRQQAYAQVLQPKLTEVAVLLDRLARCRQQQARLIGFDSYLELTQQRMTLGSSSPEQQTSAANLLTSSATCVHRADVSDRPVNFLLQLAAALQPLAQQEVAFIARDLHQNDTCQHQMTGNENEVQTNLQQQEQQLQQKQLTDKQEQQHSSSGPWDWDYLLYQAQHGHLLVSKDLQQHLHLHGVVRGFSSLLQHLLGVQLVLRPAGLSEVWGQHVVTLMVVKKCTASHAQSAQQQQAPQQQTKPVGPQEQSSYDQVPLQCELIGTIYLDIGGAYGCRMLRYTRGSTCSKLADANAWQDQVASAPAVAVGLSGSLLEVSAGERQQQPSRQRPQHDCPVGLQETVVERLLFGSASGITSGGASGCHKCTVLSVSQLWEFGHEMGHALHLILSSRQPACHLSGRFAPPNLLEVPSQLMERLFTDSAVLAQLCLHHETQQRLPAELAEALADYYSCRYNSALGVMSRVAAGLAEQMYGRFGGDGEDYWRGAWQAVSGLPDAVAAHGCLKELSLLPVMAAHPGTYHSYLTSWYVSAKLYDKVFKPLLRRERTAAEQIVLQQKALASFEGLNTLHWSGMLVGALDLPRLQVEVSTDTIQSDARTAAESRLYDTILAADALTERDVQRWVWKPDTVSVAAA